MANLKKLLLATLNAADDSHPHDGELNDASIAKEISESHFRVETTRPGTEGRPADLIAGEYLVMTDAEATEAGYTQKGALQTKDKDYKVYRAA